MSRCSDVLKLKEMHFCTQARVVADLSTAYPLGSRRGYLLFPSQKYDSWSISPWTPYFPLFVVLHMWYHRPS